MLTSWSVCRGARKIWARGARIRKSGREQDDRPQHLKGSMQPREVNVLRFPGGGQRSELEKGSMNFAWESSGQLGGHSGPLTLSRKAHRLARVIPVRRPAPGGGK